MQLAGGLCKDCFEARDEADEQEDSDADGPAAPDHVVDENDPVIRHLFESKSSHITTLNLLIDKEAWKLYSDTWYLSSLQELQDLITRWGGSMEYTTYDGDFSYSFHRVTGVPFSYSPHHPRGPWSHKSIGAEKSRDESDSD